MLVKTKTKEMSYGEEKEGTIPASPEQPAPEEWSREDMEKAEPLPMPDAPPNEKEKSTEKERKTGAGDD